MLSIPSVQREYVVKAQVHAGGRGKGGGIKVVDNSQDATAGRR